MRNGLLCLACSAAFAAFARRSGSDLALLEELQLSLDRRPTARSRRGQQLADAELMRQMQNGNDDEAP